MKKAVAALAATVCCAGALVGVPAATAAPGRAAAGKAMSVVADWQLNEAPGARVMVDNGPRHLDGSVGSLVRTGAKVNGATAYSWSWAKPNTPPAQPQRLVTIDSAALNPGSADYAITFRYRTTHRFGNIIQKGQATTAGGQVKIELPNGYVTCLFNGANGRRAIRSTIAINDGQWHTVTCSRTSAGVTVSIDGTYRRTIKGWTGPISNSWPMTIGGKPRCDQVKVTCDYFVGEIDWVRVEAG